LLPALLALLLGSILPAAAQACSQDDTAYFDGFLDTTCLDSLGSTTLDTFGGLRLTTNGSPTATGWDTEGEFTSGVNWSSKSFAPVGLSTLAIDASGGSGPPAKLVLPSTPLPLTSDESNPVLSTAAAVVTDNDGVTDPSVARVGSKYLMWYAGTAEDGSGPAIFAAESGDGKAWARLNLGEPVLTGSEGAFDEHGVAGPDVVYDGGDVGAPYKMWYSGQGAVFGAIGYATSVDGIVWTKHDDVETPTPADPVLDHGAPGSPDSFAAADPTVLRDGTTWKMWYTGDDSNKKRIAYATSPDGIVWAKGGKVISPEDAGTNANIEFGAYAPTVWKSNSTYRMLLSGRKIVSGGRFATKLLGTSSADGIEWSGPSTALNPSGTEANFDHDNLDSPVVLEDPGTPEPFKLYYAGNTITPVTGAMHDRIGLATSTNGNLTGFGKFAGGQAGGSVLDIGQLGTAFDARRASGPSVVARAGPEPGFIGFYSGSRGSDFKPRLGEAESDDGGAWTKVPVSEPNGGALFPLGGVGAFDHDGERDPGVLYEQDGVGEDDYFLYFTGIEGATRSIGVASAEEDAVTGQPDNGTWSARNEVLEPDGSGFDSTGVSHPSLIRDTDYVLYYTGTNSAGETAIGRATGAANGPEGPFGTRSEVELNGEPTCDPDGYRNPVVVKAGANDYRMLYTGLEKLEGHTIERGCYATSEDGEAWIRYGIALDPSRRPYSGDELGVEPTGMLIDESTLHVFSSGVDRTGRTRGDHATTAYPTATGSVANGSATYQLGDQDTPPQDFRNIRRGSGGNSVELWMSYEQPYSKSAGEQFWSEYFPVTVEGPEEALAFLLTVRGIRWQARLSEPSAAPQLDKVEIEHAPILFSSAGSATTTEISPPSGVAVGHWNSVTASGELFSPAGSGSASGTVEVLSGDGAQVLASHPLSTNGDTEIDISALSAASHPSLRVRFDLASASPFSATPLVTSVKVLYNSESPPPPLPPPPAAPTPSPVVLCLGRQATIVGTPGADDIRGTAKADVIATLHGNDRIRALRGNDRICGGGGSDRIYGAAGKDLIAGGAGADLAFGGAGADRVFGGGGNDRLAGNGGADTVKAGAGRDQAYGGKGDDRLFGQAGKDQLSGGSGKRDLCHGGGGRDRAARSCERLRRVP
jgi:predicted GH43/DUF377 family glycosyl hydrolase